MTVSARASGTRSQPVSEPRPGRVRPAGDVDRALHDVGQPERLQHVPADPVGAEGHRVREPGRVRVPDGVVQVRHRVVEDRPPQGVIGRQVDAVGQQPVVPGEAGEPARRVDVADALADVDVDADPQVLGQAGGRAQGFVRAGEGGVDPHQAPTAGPDEALVLGEAAPGAVGPVAIGDPVGEQRPDPDLGARLGDHVEAALDGVGGLVVVDDRGRAVLERLEGAEHRRPADHLEVEGRVEAPPDLLEDLLEAHGDLRRRRASPGRAPSTGDGARRRGPA